MQRGFDFNKFVYDPYKFRNDSFNKNAARVILCENPTVTELLDRDRERATCRNIGTFSNSDGTIGYDPREEVIEEFIRETANLQEKLEILKQFANESRLDSLREKIESLQKQQVELSSEAGKNLLVGIGEALSVAFTLEVFPIAVIGFVTACRSFYESAEKYCESLDVREQIESMIKLEKSLDKNKEQERLNELRAR